MTEAQRLAHQLANNIGGVRPAEAAAELRRLDRLCSERFENYRALAQQARRFEAECEALRKDAERLNWLEQGGQWELTRLRASAKPDAMRYWMVEDFAGDDLTQDTDEAERQTLRGAIDAAMGKEKV